MIPRPCLCHDAHQYLNVKCPDVARHKRAEAYPYHERTIITAAQAYHEMIMAGHIGIDGDSSTHVPVSASAPRPDRVDYPSWACDCPVQAKTGMPVRHIWQRGVIVVLPVKADDVTAPAECPTWRPAVKTWHRTKQEVAVPEPAPVEHPAGPVGPLRPVTAADLPPRCSAKGVLPHASSAYVVAGRQVDDGPVVVRLRLAGRTWVAYWTDGAFASAQIDGRRANLVELRKLLKD